MENNKKRIIQVGAIITIILLIAFLLLIFKDKIFIKSEETSNNDNYQDDTTINKQDTPTYSIFPREPYLNASDILTYNINIGGSKTDIAKKMIFLNDLYILGETNSTDYDFKGEGKRLFLAKLNSFGSLNETHTFLNSNNVNFVDASSFSLGTENKIAVLANKENGLTLTSINLKDYNINEFSLENYFGVKLYIKNDCIVVIAEFKNNNSIKNIEVITLSFDLQLLKRYTLSYQMNLKLKDSFLYADKLLILADASDTTQNFFIITKLDINEKSINLNLNKIFKSNENFTSIKLAPNKSMGVSVLYKVNSPTSYLKLTILDSELNIISTFTHSLTNIDDGDIFVNTSFDNSLGALVVSGYYILAYKDNLCSTDYVCTHGDLQHSDIAPLKDIGKVNDYISNRYQNIFLSTYTSVTNTTQIRITIIDKMHSPLANDTFGGSQSDNAIQMAVKDNENIFILANSFSKNYDVANNFGECDVWLTNYLKK